MKNKILTIVKLESLILILIPFFTMEDIYIVFSGNKHALIHDCYFFSTQEVRTILSDLDSNK